MKLPTTKVEYSKITNPYSLLAVVGVVLEGLLGFWFHKAGGSVERSVAGLFMLLLFFGLFYVVIQLRAPRDTGALETGAGKVQLIAADTTAREALSVPEEECQAPDGSFTIRRPPSGWIAKNQTVAEGLAETQKIPVDVAAKYLGVAADQQMLVLRKQKERLITPIPGTTIVDGRKLPTALDVPAIIGLTILPMDRAQPPLFVERSLEHNFILATQANMQGNLMTLRKLGGGKTPNGKTLLLAEFEQTLVNATVDGLPGKNLAIMRTVIAVEGELRDHLLIMSYISMATPDDEDCESDKKTLLSLVNSFRPTRVLNAEQQREKISILAEKQFSDLMTQKGETMFWTEFGVLMLRCREVDLSLPEQRHRAVNLLKPFRSFAKLANVQDDTLEELWKALDKADSGDETELKAHLAELVQSVADEIAGKSDTTTQPDRSLKAASTD